MTYSLLVSSITNKKCCCYHCSAAITAAIAIARALELKSSDSSNTSYLSQSSQQSTNTRHQQRIHHILQLVTWSTSTGSNSSLCRTPSCRHCTGCCCCNTWHVPWCGTWHAAVMLFSTHECSAFNIDYLVDVIILPQRQLTKNMLTTHTQWADQHWSASGLRLITFTIARWNVLRPVSQACQWLKVTHGNI